MVLMSLTCAHIPILMELLFLLRNVLDQVMRNICQNKDVSKSMSLEILRPMGNQAVVQVCMFLSLCFFYRKSSYVKIRKVHTIRPVRTKRPAFYGFALLKMSHICQKLFYTDGTTFGATFNQFYKS